VFALDINADAVAETAGIIDGEGGARLGAPFRRASARRDAVSRTPQAPLYDRAAGIQDCGRES
jgi:hypothetical protein